MSIHRAKYLIAAAALSVATLLLAGTTAAAVSQETCTGHWLPSPSDPPPGVLGQSAEKAAESLRDDGYDCKVVNDKPADVDEQTVVVAAQNTRTENDPDGGTTSLVHLSLGVAMPDLVGKTLRLAGQTVTRLGLAVRTSPSDGAADWIVRLQRPGAGDYVVFERAVTLILEKPVQPVLVPVPDLIERTEDEAAALVKDAGLKYKERILKDGQQPGRVVSQQPQPGELVERTTTVTADVRRVPAPPPTTVVPTPPLPPPVVVRTVVPDLVGRLESTAKQAVGVARLKFQSRVVRPGSAPGIVLNQRPRAGSEVDVGTVVAVDVTRAPKPKLVPVPDLLNRSEDEARGAVEGVELIFDLIGGRDASGRDRQVISQQPRAGELVPTGATVTVEFAADESNWPSWLVPLLLGTAVLAAGTISRIRHRPGRDPKPKPVPQIHVAERLTLGIPQLHESGPAHRIRINARLERGRQSLQEKSDEHQ
ncbi:beta-lactam-binding protein with PASTA domain [Kribbella sp. VKM Ac-2569]|uniref:PASTA domain-containing protein n=1 Tax=Kribbella sp. VKM Ac-2569 TaxID=2512220 RepID=UPI00102C45A1|nr:PASTA domain-containing protein [Kribbella sp. VKM Ac-2569]RZT28010.1 beta-lactam-binding protein with PASTA domain [Kribbella sp. VKM Ac-2569]